MHDAQGEMILTLVPLYFDIGHRGDRGLTGQEVKIGKSKAVSSRGQGCGFSL